MKSPQIEWEEILCPSFCLSLFFSLSPIIFCHPAKDFHQENKKTFNESVRKDEKVQ